MAIPDFQTIMLPLLKFANDGKDHTLPEAIDYLAAVFKLTDAEKKELLPSETQTRFDNRIAWARSYMKQAGLLENPIRGVFRITDRGKAVLEKKPTKIDINFLTQFEEFVEFKSRSKKSDNREDATEEIKTPKEYLEEGYQKIRAELMSELLSLIKRCPPDFFERTVIELLIKMGYGGSRKDAGQAIGKTGDGGIDGIIKEDRLGLDVIYIQAKRWESVVGRPEIQKFAGALQGQRAKKGIFITTSNFSKDATDYASNIDCKIILIDGERLSQLMIDYDLGVSKVASYDIKKIDNDYFTEE